MYPIDMLQPQQQGARLREWWQGPGQMPEEYQVAEM
jgi:hypothetical protein